MSIKKAILIPTICVAGVAVILGGIFVGGALSYKMNKKFLNNTVINNVNVGGLTIEEAKSKINSNIGKYRLSVKDKNNSEKIIRPNDIDMKYNVEEYSLTEEFEKQNQFEWVYGLFSDNVNVSIGGDLSFDENRLDEKIKSFDLNKERKKPTDAFIKKGKTSLYIEKENPTDYFDIDNVKKSIKESLTKMDSEINIESNEFYLPPKIKTNDLKATLQELEASLSRKLVMTCVTDDIEIKQTLVYDWSQIKNNKIVGFDKEKISNYVDDVCSKYDTVNKDRKFKTSNGKTITVGSGTYGWQVSTEKTVEKIISKLMDSSFEGKFAAAYSMDGFSIPSNGNDIGNTYVEISISDQHMWYYKEGKLLVETDVVTGNNDGEHDTPKGVWYVLYKDSPATLVGENDEYRTEVQYWMPITYSGVGIHDSSWRGSEEYGGNTYTYNGSHGCINTPYDKVEKIYKNLDAGTPVVVY